MKLMTFFLRKHGLIFIFAFAIGLLMAAPTLFAIMKIGSDFRGIYPMLSNDEDQYLAMTREVYDGHYNLGSVYLKEHKDAPYLQQPLAEIIFANIAKFFQISIPKLFAINDFLLPFFGVLILYFLIFALTESGVISGVFSVLYYLLFISQFNRPINPQFSFLFLFAGFIFIWQIINNDKGSLKRVLIFNLLLALDFGIAFYIYPFVWSSIFVVYCLTLFTLSVKEKEITYFLKNFLAFIVPSAIFSIPYILNLKRAILDANYTDQNLRFGFFTTHWPHAYFNVSLMIICLIILYFIGKVSNVKRKIFSYCLAFAGIILNWQNIITGKAFSFSMHYYWVVVLFLFLIFSVCMAYIWNNYKNKSLNWRDFVAIFLILIFLGELFYKERGGANFGFSGLINSIDVTQFRNLQKLSGVAEWFEENSPRDSAVLSLGKHYYWFIPAYTYNNNFQNANAGLFLISDDELENRWAIQNFFKNGIDAKYIEKHSVEIWADKFIEKYQHQKIKNKILSLTGIRKADASIIFIPKEYIDRVLSKIAFYRKQGFKKSLKQYSVDYILLDKSDAEYGFLSENFSEYQFLLQVADIENNLIFKVVNK